MRRIDCLLLDLILENGMEQTDATQVEAESGQGGVHLVNKV
jgi:hypothetical protein